MAERRMFAKTIIDSDAFLDMPLSTQALYFHLSMRADDDGFINNPKKIQRMIGGSDDDLKLLVAKNFIIPFESGIVVIKHWKIHNYIQSDRYKPTVYREEKELLEMKGNRAYTLSDTECIQDVSISETQISLGKVSLGKSSLDKSKRETTHDILERLIPVYNFSEELTEKISEWITYKTERKESYKEQGLKSLLKQIDNHAMQYGDIAICNLIDECMASNWKGIIFDILEKKQKVTSGGYQKKSKADELDAFYQMAAEFGESE